MTVVSDHDTTGKTRQTVTPPDDDQAWLGGGLLVVFRLLIPIIAALLIFAHGCHTGDHDDEPSFAPPFHDSELPR